MLHSKVSRLSVISLVLLIFLGFQNCSSSVLIGEAPSPAPTDNVIKSAPPDIAIEREGNGAGYEGKLYAVTGFCGGVPHSPVSQIKVATDRSRSHLTRDNCRPTDIPINPAHLNFLNDNELEYQGRQYRSQDLVVSALLNRYDSVGTHVWVKPGVGSSVRVECWGGGGGAGGGGGTGSVGGGGGGGGFSQQTFNFSQLNPMETITVGAGGAGAVSWGRNGADGGASSFGSLLVSGGGGGGLASCNGGNGGAGGPGVTESGRSGSVNLGGNAGGGGGQGGADATSGLNPGGGGGGSWGGGGGGACGNQAGPAGNGGSGLCVVTVLP